MRWVVFLFMAGRLLFGAEAEFNLRVTPSATEVSITDSLEIRVDLTFPKGYRLDLEALQQNLLRSSNFYQNPFTLNEMKLGDVKEQNEGVLSQQIQLILQPLRIGDVNFTLYDVTFIPSDVKKKASRLISPIFPIQILPVAAPEHFQGELAPLMTFSKEFPMTLSESNQKFIADDEAQKKVESLNEKLMDQKRLPWIEAGSLLLILFVFWTFLRHPPAKSPLSAEQIVKEAREAALLNLEKLRAKKLPEKGFFDQFYVELVDPVRAYIEKRYDLPASKSTTPEFLTEAAKNSALSEEKRQKLARFLQEADKVKFGRFKPSLEECHQAEILALQFIESD